MVFDSVLIKLNLFIHFLLSSLCKKASISKKCIGKKIEVLINPKKISTSLIKKPNPNICFQQKILKSEELKKKADIDRKKIMDQLQNKVRAEIQNNKLLEINKKKNEKSIIKPKVGKTFKIQITKKIDSHNKM